MDVETAFLNGKVLSEVYVKEAKEFENGTDRVYKLDKALYGLRESPRAWYKCFDKFLEKLGFERNNYDYCLYILKDEKDEIYLILFVDDLLICGKNKVKIEKIKSILSKRFKMKDLGEVKNYLGISINYDSDKNLMTMSQERYIESLAARYEIEDSKLYNTPMEVNLQLKPAQEISYEIGYRNLIGSLLFISSATRPDVSYCANSLSRFQNCYDVTHFKYALRVLKYLYLTKNLKLVFRKSVKAEILDCFVDAERAGDPVDRKSTTGYVIRLYRNVIYCKSREYKEVSQNHLRVQNMYHYQRRLLRLN